LILIQVADTCGLVTLVGGYLISIINLQAVERQYPCLEIKKLLPAYLLQSEFWKLAVKTGRYLLLPKGADHKQNFSCPDRGAEWERKTHKCGDNTTFIGPCTIGCKKKKTGNKNFPNVNLVLTICQLIVYLTVPIK
jgi:hypothetical protein